MVGLTFAISWFASFSFIILAFLGFISFLSFSFLLEVTMLIRVVWFI